MHYSDRGGTLSPEAISACYLMYDKGWGARRMARGLQSTGLDGRANGTLVRYIVRWRQKTGLLPRQESVGKPKGHKDPIWGKVTAEEMDQRLAAALEEERQILASLTARQVRRSPRCAWCDTAPHHGPCAVCAGSGVA